MKKFLCYDTEQAARGEINVDNRGVLKPVDSELSDASTNPVQNKVIKSALDSLSEEIANLGGGDDVSVEPAEDDIPKVFFGGALQQTKDTAVVPFRYISKTRDISGYAEIKAQGNSSMSYPKKESDCKAI